MRKIAAIIPCYDVALFCEKVIEQAIPFVDQLILVDDGSKDGTELILKKIHGIYPRSVHLIRFPENRGKGFALIEGLRYALHHVECQIFLTLDGDGQHRPSDIPQMALGIEKGADLVIGERQFEKMPFYSKIGNSIISFLLRVRYGKAPLDTQSGLRAFSRSFAKEIVEKIEGGRYEMEFRVLLLALKEKRRIDTHLISTIYFDKNIHSHFSKLRDSFRILKVLLIHILTGGLV